VLFLESDTLFLANMSILRKIWFSRKGFEMKSFS
jgi:hypothetical protein